MSMSSMRRIVVVLLPTQDAAEQHSLLNAAAAMSSDHHCPLDIVALRGGTQVDVTPAPDLPAHATWWDVVHDGLVQLSTDSLAELAAQALAAAQLAPTMPRLVLLPPGPDGIEVAALLAWRMDGAALGQCMKLEIDGAAVIGHRAGHGGRIMLTLRTQQAQCFATLRAETRPERSALCIAPDRHALALSGTLPEACDVTSIEQTDALPSLEGAKLIVSGGRGMQGDEGFGLLRDIAQRLNGALGGSLPTVDAGWIPVARQIGQSGKFVSPRIYLAVGISGTLQHLAGISSETTIIAVNKDPDAPIFSVAEAGAVGDWREILPALLDRLESTAAEPA
ncbi:electron transfer flavoprotein subunit alpha/FixB family protein [Polaromonas hydrogenivorans]|uniref:Electron transfer flavoprotein subunit alpha/FixB family protein n=1 Tax=Polaromonas hydrogenivorans TaxID=335476 RepID=A0AAU7LZS7_9BURK